MCSSAIKMEKLVIDDKQDDEKKSDHENGNAHDEDIFELEYLRKLFVGGLSPKTTEANLKTFYEQWGNVMEVVVMRDTTSKRSRGFGFITYTKSSMVDKAQDNRPHVIDEKTVEAKRALPRPERDSREATMSVKKLFVGGLKDVHDENCLREYFSQFGKVISVNVLTDKVTGRRRGFAYIAFDDYDAVDKAILQRAHSIKYVVVDVKKSVYKQDTQRDQQRQQADHSGTDAQMKKAKSDIQSGPSDNRVPSVDQPLPQNMPPMNGGQPAAPPANYNYWGQQPPAMPYGYQQPQQQQPMNNWGYPPAPHAWYGGPPQPAPSAPMPNSWYPQPQSWGGPPQQHPSMVPNWNAPGPQAMPPPQQQQPQPMPQPQQMPHNFGIDYRQNYNGGPTKYNVNANRMNPYGWPPSNAYGNQPRPVPPVGAGVTYQY